MGSNVVAVDAKTSRSCVDDLSPSELQEKKIGGVGR